MTYDDLIFHPVGNKRLQAKVEFRNGYGASVVLFLPEAGFELAVMKDGHLCYNTPITSDVLKNLTPEDITRYLKQIEALGAYAVSYDTANMQLTPGKVYQVFNETGNLFNIRDNRKKTIICSWDNCAYAPSWTRLVSAPARPDISEGLRDHLTKWLKEKHNNSLCQGLRNELHDELVALFNAHDLDPTFPFNPGGLSAYHLEIDRHANSARVAFVHKVLGLEREKGDRE